MDDGIIQDFPHSVLGNFQRLLAAHSLVVYGMDEVSGTQGFHYSVGHPDQVAVYQVLVHQRSLAVSETANLYASVEAVLLRVFTEEKQGRHRHLSVRSHHFQVAQYLFGRVVLSAEMPCRTFCKAFLVKSGPKNVPKIENLN